MGKDLNMNAKIKNYSYNNNRTDYFILPIGTEIFRKRLDSRLNKRIGYNPVRTG